MVSQRLIEELKTILKKDYDKKLDIKKVAEIANGLVGYFDLLAKIYHQKNNKTNEVN